MSETVRNDLRIATAITPLIDGKRIIAINAYYAYLEEDGRIEAGVVDLGSSKQARDALEVAVFARAMVAWPEMAASLGFFRKPMATLH